MGFKRSNGSCGVLIAPPDKGNPGKSTQLYTPARAGTTRDDGASLYMRRGFSISAMRQSCQR